MYPAVLNRCVNWLKKEAQSSYLQISGFNFIPILIATKIYQFDKISMITAMIFVLVLKMLIANSTIDVEASFSLKFDILYIICSCSVSVIHHFVTFTC